MKAWKPFIRRRQRAVDLVASVFVGEGGLASFY